MRKQKLAYNVVLFIHHSLFVDVNCLIIRYFKKRPVKNKPKLQNKSEKKRQKRKINQFFLAQIKVIYVKMSGIISEPRRRMPNDNSESSDSSEEPNTTIWWFPSITLW